MTDGIYKSVPKIGTGYRLLKGFYDPVLWCDVNLSNKDPYQDREENEIGRSELMKLAEIFSWAFFALLIVSIWAPKNNGKIFWTAIVLLALGCIINHESSEKEKKKDEKSQSRKRNAVNNLFKTWD